MDAGAISHLLSVLSGGVVGFSLGLIGGGGSILAVPLMLYVVGVRDPHVAIGTSALAVSANALINLGHHARAGNVKWPCATVFALSGVIGAVAGAKLGSIVDGQKLLFFFGLVMIVVGITMLVPRSDEGDPSVHITPAIAWRLVAIGLVAGLFSGFFGIGGGFLVVPGLIAGAGMPIISAVGSSLFSVAAFGLTTSVVYAFSGMIDWTVALEFIAGGAIGGWLGMKLAVRLAGGRRLFTWVFAAVIFAVAVYVMKRSVGFLI